MANFNRGQDDPRLTDVTSDNIAGGRRVTEFLIEGGHRVLGWRQVPLDNSDLGESVLPSEPVIRQVFVGCAGNCLDQDSFERKLFAIRKGMDNSIREAGHDKTSYYVTSMSSRTITYKGMLLASQVGSYYLDLKEEIFGLKT